MPTRSSPCVANDSYCYIGQVNYWTTDEKRTRLTASVYAGPNAIFAAPNLAGTYDTMVELRVQQDWSERFTQVLQNNMGWDANTPVGTGSWYGLYFISIYHLNTQARRPLSGGVVRRRQGHANRGRHQLLPK